MSIATVVCRGYGPGASVAFVSTRGYTISAAAIEAQISVGGVAGPQIVPFSWQQEITLTLDARERWSDRVSWRGEIIVPPLPGEIAIALALDACEADCADTCFATGSLSVMLAMAAMERMTTDQASISAELFNDEDDAMAALSELLPWFKSRILN